MTTQQRITDSVRALAAVTGTTNRELAAVLGQSESSAGKKRSGGVDWTLADVAALATHYGVTDQQILAGVWAWLGVPEPQSSESTAA